MKINKSYQYKKNPSLAKNSIMLTYCFAAFIIATRILFRVFTNEWEILEFEFVVNTTILFFMFASLFVVSKIKIYYSIIGAIIFNLTISIIVLATVIGIWPIVLFVHFISVCLLAIILNQQAVRTYLFIALISNVFVYCLRIFNFFPYEMQVMTGDDKFDGLLTVSLIGLTASTSVMRYVFYSMSKLEETEQKLLVERDRLEVHVAKRTADLQIALKHKDAFLATMSHELRTPLNAILSRTQAAEMGVYGEMNKPFSKLINGISLSGENLLDLINDVLDVSKIEAGAMGLNFEAVNISAVCQNIISGITPLVAQNKLTLTTNFQHQVSHIEADPKRLQQIITNLISNAIKFTPEGKQIGIDITDDAQNKTITFAIWDEGIGISDTNQVKLFQPFTQIDSALSRQYEGSGLGLSIVKKLVQLHNGSITLESNLHQGSRFSVTLPWHQSIDHSLLLNTPPENKLDVREEIHA